MSTYQQPVKQPLDDILFLIVLFNQSPAQSETYQSLASALNNSDADYQIILFDNTPKKSTYIPSDSRVIFYSEGINEGLPTAYNFAAQKALVADKKYLILLDQDSSINLAYLHAVSEGIGSMSDNDAVLVPDIISAQKAVSPYTINDWGIIQLPPNSAKSPLSAINSFSVISLNALTQVGGFDTFYWLDALDFHFFHQVHKQGLNVKRLNVTVEHNLSLSHGAVPRWRLNNIARYEMAFYAECLSPPAILLGLLRVLARGIKRRQDLHNTAGLFAYAREAFIGLFLGVKRRYNSGF